MSFGRFVWLLQTKALWLSRGDLLGDEWEGQLFRHHVDHILNAVAADAAAGKQTPFQHPAEAAVSLRNLIAAVVRSSYISCWSVDDHENHALWRIYCRSCEGVAIQTTIGALRASLADDIDFGPVGYSPELERPGLEFGQIVSTKRPMFKYEREWRVVRVFEDLIKTASENSAGIPLPWQPERVIENILIHPEADKSFVDVVRRTVLVLAPELADKVRLSSLAAEPFEEFVPAVQRLSAQVGAAWGRAEPV